MNKIYSSIKSVDTGIIRLVYILTVALFLIFVFILFSYVASKHNEENLHNKIKNYHMKSIQLALASIDEIHKTNNWFKSFEKNSKITPYIGLHPHNQAKNITETLKTNAKIISKAQDQFNDPEFNVIINNINAATGSLTKTLAEATKDVHAKGAHIHAHKAISINTNELFSPLIASYRQLKKMHEINLKQVSKNNNLLESGNTSLILITILLLFITGFIILFLVIKKIRATLVNQSELFSALRSSDEQVHLLLSSSSEAIYGIDLNGHCTFANKACASILGYEDPDTLLGENMHDLIHHSHSDDTHYPVEKCSIYKAHTEGCSTHVDDEIFWRKNGESFPVEYWSNPVIRDHKILGSVINFVDISEKKKIADELSRKQETLDKAQGIAHIGSWNWNILTNELDWSDEIYRIFGIEPQSFDATYEGFLEAVHPEDRQSVISEVENSVNQAGHQYDIEHRVITPGGDVRVVHEQGLVYRDEDLNPYQMIGTVMDITGRTKSEKDLNTFKTTLDMTLDCVFMFDPITLKFFYVNEGAVDQVGYSIEEMYEMTPVDIKPQFDEKTFREKIEPLKSGKVSALNFETIHRHKNGHDTHVEISLQLVTPARDTPRFVAMVRDISERRANENELKVYRTHLETLVNERTRKLEETRDELIRSERMATLGKLTATVSHELRNPLGAMRPSLHIIKSKEKGIDDTHVQEAIDRVDRNITRCDHIIDELLDFTRCSEPMIQHIVLDDWINQLLDEQIIPEQIILTRDLNTGRSTIAFDPERMRRAVINILENAFHATIAGYEDKGRNKMTVTLSSDIVNDQIEITVTDTGTGIPDDVLSKIFEPLFSTKGFGVGLGMPIVKQIIEQHQGNISVNTQTGKGTSITLRFPVRTDKGAVA